MDSVIVALMAALDKNPDDTGIRLHLGQLLLEHDEPDTAQEHFDIILKNEPANLDALNGAAETAERMGKNDKAESYKKLIAAMTHQSVSGKGTSKVANNETVGLRLVESGSNVAEGPWEVFDEPITLKDVGGMEDVKKRLDMSFLAPLRNPEVRKLYSKNLRGGLMLYGPPGCGKTFIARALAGELGATFISVGLSDVLDMWLGESERKLHELFETARRKAPAILFFDEIDALGQKRSQLKHSAGRNLVNQMLAEMDSVGSDNQNVFMLSATNHPWDVDTALRRPGRFDRVVLVLPPDPGARRQILEYHMRDRPMENVDMDVIANKTSNFSGADLAHLCDSAVEYAMHDSLESGNVRGVSTDDFKQAFSDISPSTNSWFDMAKNYAMFANEGGTYDDLLDYIRTR